MSRYRQLTDKVDGFFARVDARHHDDIECHTGCADCCHTRLTITRVEAAAIEAATLPPDLHDLARRNTDRCAALGDDDRCRIYDVRPIVCRSHGAPIRMIEKSLPVIRNCHRNFTDRDPSADCVIDQTTLSTLVLAVNRAEGYSDDRVDLAELLVRLTG